MSAATSLVDQYINWLDRTIDEKGVELPWGLSLGEADKLTVFALALPPPQAYQIMLVEWASNHPKELIFAFDRFAKPGQGTTLGDLMAGHHFVRGHCSSPFIVEYQHAPRIRQPIDWGNAFWNAALTQELANSIRFPVHPKGTPAVAPAGVPQQQEPTSHA